MSVSSVGGAGGSAHSDYAEKLKAAIAARLLLPQNQAAVIRNEPTVM